MPRGTAWVLFCLLLAGCAPSDRHRLSHEGGALVLVILDAATREPVPARVELLDEAGRGHIAGDALPILVRSHSHARPIDTTFDVRRRFPNPQTGTDQFYSTGRSILSLPPGRYRLRVWKGPEYQVFKARLRIEPGDVLEREVELARWIDMPRRGWYGADGHLHLPRPTPEANAGLLQWMAAEDLHVANLLQMGTPEKFDFAPQYAHGERGHHGDGSHFLVSGQENPRTHFMGHMIILGTREPIHYPERYLDLPKFFAEAHRQGALNGVGHYGWRGGELGLSLLLPRHLLDFLEVLQFERGRYDIWYKVLNSGFRLTPTAGTDYPWGHSYPGRERFYTHVAGDFTLAKWIEAVDAGHTFVTNGPMLEFTVDGKLMGQTIDMPRPGKVQIQASVRFNPRVDTVSELELVENGVVVRTVPAGRHNTAHIDFRAQHEIRRSGWLALRAGGTKTGEPPVRQSQAHSAPIYVSVANGAPRAGQDDARRMARCWLTYLADLERELSDANIEALAQREGSGRISLETLRQNRPGLLRDIAEAREYFQRLAIGAERDAPPPE